jgi:hypothetical protein
MVRAAPKSVDGQDSKQKDVLISIVPVDETIEATVPPVRSVLESQPQISAQALEERWETAPLQDPEPEAKAEAKPAPAPEPPKTDTPKPAPQRSTGLLVAMSMGGGLLLGGGAVTAIALLGILLGGVGVAVVLLMWLASVDVAPVPAVPVADLENPAAEAPVASPVTPAPDASAGGAPAEPVAAPNKPEAQKPAPATPTEKAPASTTPASSTPVEKAPPAPVPAATTPAPVETTPTPVPAPAQNPAPAPAAKPAGGLILVKILSDPPAALLTVDGEGRGRTPTKLELEPGTHQITLTAGSAKGAFTIDVAPDDDKFCYGLSGKKVVRTGCE